MDLSVCKTLYRLAGTNRQWSRTPRGSPCILLTLQGPLSLFRRIYILKDIQVGAN